MLKNFDLYIKDRYYSSKEPARLITSQAEITTETHTGTGTYATKASTVYKHTPASKL